MFTLISFDIYLKGIILIYSIPHRTIYYFKNDPGILCNNDILFMGGRFSSSLFLLTLRHIDALFSILSIPDLCMATGKYKVLEICVEWVMIL